MYSVKSVFASTKYYHDINNFHIICELTNTVIPCLVTQIQFKGVKNYFTFFTNYFTFKLFHIQVISRFVELLDISQF
jgi:hypothetical protein